MSAESDLNADYVAIGQDKRASSVSEDDLVAAASKPVPSADTEADSSADMCERLVAPGEPVRCGRRWKGHVCVLPATATTEDSPTGQHEHRCLCGFGWVSRHPYHRSKFSGAGNCWCGRHEGAKTHA